MGIRDELRRLGAAARQIAGAQGRAAVSATADWLESRANTARAADIDTRLQKAASEAIAAGNDGTHDFGEAKGVRFDPFDLVAVMGYRDKPSPLTFPALETVGASVPVIADIVKTRQSQVCMFVGRPENRHASGFKVRPRDQAQRRKASKAGDRKAEELTKILLNCGRTEPDTDHAENEPLLTFAKKSIRDTLIFDQWAWEIVPDRRGDPAYFAMLDPSTVRLVDPGLRQPGDPYAVQVINGMIVSDFQPEELAFCIRNPRSGIRVYGYGQSETETLVREITGMLWGIEYNRGFFSRGTATKGILNFKGAIPDRHLQAFRRQWYSMVSGVNNSWRTPITNAEELQWINMQLTNRDMEYSAWMDWLTKIACARFQIAPEEVNFSYGNTGQNQAMGQAPLEEKLKASRDLGLRPLVRFFFDELNRNFLWRLEPDFEAVPIGLDEKGEEAEAALLQQLTMFGMTVDEARESLELDPMPDGKGECILNPTWLQFAGQLDMQKQQEQGGGMGAFGGGPGAPPNGGPPGAPGEEQPGGFPFGVDSAPSGGENPGVAEPAAQKSEAPKSNRVRFYEVDIRR